ncbi:MAG: type II toxin-antitoxin system VapC family toxin [Candidatus Freyrarchaeum guaymaensis]
MVYSKAGIEGVVDVGLIVLSHCENPAKGEALDFLEKVLLGEQYCIIPLAAFIGAYHILTRYLRVNRDGAKQELLKTLSFDLEIFYHDVTRDEVIESLVLASEFSVEGWDGYLINVARRFETNNIYTIDRRLVKVPSVNVIIPISEKVLRAYHIWVKERVTS